MSDSLWQTSADLDTLEKRARMLQSIRAFFAVRDVLELETPLLAASAVTDVHLDSMQLSDSQRYLNTSPEYCMKRFVAEHQRDVYQICKSFRQGEAGRWHNPEFTMLEWYRIDFSLSQLIEEVSDIIRSISSIFGDNSVHVVCLSYAEVFHSVTGIDPHHTDVETLAQYAQAHDVAMPVGLNTATDSDALQAELDLNAWQDWLMSVVIAPALAPDQYTFIYGYPATQAALARIELVDGVAIASRFELYRGETELANGYAELADADEQRTRFEKDNALRVKAGKSGVDMDEKLLAALQSGLPACSGVAIGLDRLLATMLDKQQLADCIAYDYTKV